MIIKVCGLTNPAEAEYLNENKADLAGMVLFFPKSKRNISIDQAKKILAALDQKIKSVAVVVSPDLNQVKAIEEAGFDYIQIHGSIPDGYFESCSLKVLKAFNISDMEMYGVYHGQAGIAGYVFDAQEPGSGKVFDWSLVKQIPRDEKMLLLAGGLNAENVAEAIRYLKPDGVDVSSGVENKEKPGKSREEIRRFVEIVRTSS